MNDTEHLPAQTSDAEGQIAALQRQIFLLLLALVVISATLVFYLFCESHFLSRDLEDIRPQALQIIRAYNTNKQAISGFHQALGNYALTHPSFRPVLEKYGWKPPTSGPQ
jgi:hypothetical protein